MPFTLCTSGAIVSKAGDGVNTAAAASAALLELYSNEAEGYINSATRVDWVTRFASVGTEFKGILSDVTSSYGGMSLIAFDMSGYTSRSEAESMINILFDRVQRGLKVLDDQSNRTEMGIT